LETVRGVGVFGRGTIGLGAGGQLIAGLRYDRSRFEADDRMPGRFPGEPLEDASGSRTMDQLSPSLGVSLSPGADHAVFANVSSLFGTPTTTELANQADGSRGFNPDLEPQTGWALEAGARGRLGDTGGYEVALFRTELEDELIPFESVEQPGRTFFKNAGSSRYQGFEAALFGQLGGVFNGRLTYTYTSAEFVEYIVDSTDLAGNLIPGQAPHRLEGVLRGEHRRGFVELRLLYMDHIPANDANTAASEAYGLADLRAGLREMDLGSLVVTPFLGVTNLFDEEYVASVVVNAFGGRYFEPGPSRSFYLGLSAAWPGA
jgi:iron complex outermembrane receptor protein